MPPDPPDKSISLDALTAFLNTIESNAPIQFTDFFIDASSDSNLLEYAPGTSGLGPFFLKIVTEALTEKSKEEAEELGMGYQFDDTFYIQGNKQRIAAFRVDESIADDPGETSSSSAAHPAGPDAIGDADTRAKLVSIAQSQLGVEEDSAHQNTGPAIKKYQASTDLGGQGWPWCAAFVDWCVQQFAGTIDAEITKVPRTPAAFGLITWANDNNFKVFNAPRNGGDATPLPGDVVVYQFSHCGIVSRSGGGGHDFFAIEGNTNTDGSSDGYEVAENGRKFSSVRKFIRLPV